MIKVKSENLAGFLPAGGQIKNHEGGEACEGGVGRGMNKRNLIRKIEKFLQDDLWGIPEVQKAVEQLEKIADKIGLFLSDVLEFRVDYDPYTRTLGVEFEGPNYRDIDDDEVLDEILDLQNIIRWAIIDWLEKMLPVGNYEIVNELFKD